MVRRAVSPRGIVGQHALEDVHARPIGGEPQPVGAARRQLPRTQVEIGNRELVVELVRVAHGQIHRIPLPHHEHGGGPAGCGHPLSTEGGHDHRKLHRRRNPRHRSHRRPRPPGVGHDADQQGNERNDQGVIHDAVAAPFHGSRPQSGRRCVLTPTVRRGRFGHNTRRNSLAGDHAPHGGEGTATRPGRGIGTRRTEASRGGGESVTGWIAGRWPRRYAQTQGQRLSTAELTLVTFLGALATALATGLGGVPVLFVSRLPRSLLGLAWGFSGGMMLSASVFNLVSAGGQLGGYNVVALGIALGAVLFWLPGRGGGGPASVFNLVSAGVQLGGYNVVALGIALGAVLFWLAERRMGHTHLDFYHLQGAPARRVLFVIGTMTIHSFSEGIAIGVSFGSGEMKLA